MNSTRAIAITGLGVALALAVGALRPADPDAVAGSLRPILSRATAPAQARPTPAVATPEPTTVLAQVAPAAPTQQVIYVQLPAAPPPQVIYVQLPAAPAVEAQPAAPAVEAQPAAPAVEAQPAAPAVEAQPADNAALWDGYNANPLPEVHCPCGIDDSAPAGATTDRQRQQSKQRTR